MKIRSGFVSNSSSSSFVVNGNSTTAQIAIMMMYEIQHERQIWGEKISVSEKFIQAILWLKDNFEYNHPIMLPWSTNYETFIWKDGNKIRIDTCNNHDWFLLNPDYGDEKGSCVTNTKFKDLSDMKVKTKDEYMEEYYERSRKRNENTES